MILVGYCDNTKGYRLLDKETYKLTKTRDVTFFERCENLDLIDINNDVSASPTNGQDKQVESQLFSSPSTSTIHTGNILVPTEQTEEPLSKIRNVIPPAQETNSDCETNTVEEALSSPYAKQWRQAMNEEYNSLMKNNTWSLKNLPSDRKVLPSKWVYKTKTDQCGNIVRFKARLVIKGYAQKGTDYEEVFSPVVKYSTIHYLISLAAKLGLETDQLDAVSAFLQGDIDVEIYMTQPELYEEGPQGGAVSWCSNRQQTVALSMAEAEYMAMSSAAQEALWLRQLHAEFGQPLTGPLQIFSDNQSAIKLSANDCYLPSKHIDIRARLTAKHVLAHYDMRLPLVSVDSSAYGLGAVLARRYPDGDQRPILCASRTLSNTERRYIQSTKQRSFSWN
ncbi:Retrovirus-related Pol polyprotein from transposon TNT 1-94 [Eumeta japonica]|uniref:Retrovirus-related Pol polyprotein from transposon TNT 1-94 n=1 Tax=Eumeta variegata TaxID=151549 RepID=A0A4C1TVF5_EUMVA|nr:Retrovirus-related Pol polyprotein from transposon TNT 1-94 [Eumeta japonica]